MEIVAWLLLAGAATIAITLFNTMVARKNAVDFAFASTDAMLKKRYDLIPNLVSVCDAYMQHERGVLRDVAEARGKAMQSKADDRLALDGQVTGRLERVFAVVESYPALKASTAMQSLQRSLNEVEEQLAASRRAYNAAVLAYNNACDMFPTNLAAMLMSYQKRQMFEVPEAERDAVRVWGR